ncbi:MAG: glycosyl transferase [Acidobacteria bacterium]|nr:glycosyl transferase [Acidobacteriota bacterium]
MSLRTRLGALLYDWPRFEAAMRGLGGYGDGTPWMQVRNRAERVESDGRGIRCLWRFTSDLHIAKVFPNTGVRLMRAAFRDWPIVLRDAPAALSVRPEVTFVIGHRGLARLPHLLATLRSIAGQTGAAVECVVVEQSAQREIEGAVPSWVRYIHTPLPDEAYDYNRSWTLNVGAKHARGELLILHDNDMLCPAAYAAEALARSREGWDFLEIKRFTFYLGEHDTARFFSTGELHTDLPSIIVQNLQGASIAATREAFFEVGGFDEGFVGWGGEDNEFWERAEEHGRVYTYGYLPFIHLRHAPQKGKLQGNDAPAHRRYQELNASMSPEERIWRLRGRPMGQTEGPSAEG